MRDRRITRNGTERQTDGRARSVREWLGFLLLLWLLLFLTGCAGNQWNNWLNDYGVEARGHRPPSARKVLALVRRAAAEREQIRAVGSGHSSSPVARPVDGQAWIDVRRIDGVQSWPFYRSEEDATRYVRVGAGATIAEINEALAERGRALFNMGNYDQQTIAGAISTGTHGSGIVHGPLADRVVALEIVTDETLEEPRGSGKKVRKQRLLRLERTHGPTSPEEFRVRATGSLPAEQGVDEMVLEQDDEAFEAALISLGTFGIIVSVTVETREAFFLQEREVLRFWDEQPVDFPTLAHAHPEFLMVQISPHRGRKGPAKGRLPYMVTKREEVIPCDLFDPRRPPSLESFGRLMGWATGTSLPEFMGREHPASALNLIYQTWKERSEREPAFVSRSDRVHINSLAPHIHATSIDIWVPLEQGRTAVDEIISLAARHENLCGMPAEAPAAGAERTIEGCGPAEGAAPLSSSGASAGVSGALEDTYWHTSPLGIRIVGESKALLSPSYDGPRVSIEIPLLVDVRKNVSEELLCKKKAYRQKMLRKLTAALVGGSIDGRPHWGHENWMTREEAERIYGDHWTRFLTQYRRFNGAGTFDNAFTDQLCISGGGTRCAEPPPDPCAQWLD